jgi:hypothetical protein
LRWPASVISGAGSEEADPPHAAGLLRARAERNRRSAAAEKRNEFAALHPITSLVRPALITPLAT